MEGMVVIVSQEAATRSIGLGETLRQQSFQERAHSSSVAGVVAMKRAPSTAQEEATPRPEPEEQPEGSDWAGPVPPSTPR